MGHDSPFDLNCFPTNVEIIVVGLSSGMMLLVTVLIILSIDYEMPQPDFPQQYDTVFILTVLASPLMGLAGYVKKSYPSRNSSI